MDRRQPSSDAFATSFRLGTLKTGVWPTVLVCAYCIVYFATTWDRPHRVALLGVAVLALASAAAVALLPMERVVRGVWREPFFVGWSASLTAMIAVVNWLDGG